MTTADEYRRLLVKHGVLLELPSAKLGNALCASLTDPASRNRVAAENAEVRNSVSFGRFSDGRRQVLILPPDVDVLTLVAGAFTAEARTGRSKEIRKAASDLLWSLPDAAEAAGIEHLPFGGTMRVLAGSGKSSGPILVDPQRLERDGDIGRASSTDYLTTGTMRTFEHDGEFYSPYGFGYCRGETTASAARLVPRSKWKGKTYATDEMLTRWHKGKTPRGDSAGVAVKVKGAPYVIAESGIMCVPDVPALRI